jgi:type II secretory pathway predicted ATPase ExeA
MISDKDHLALFGLKYNPFTPDIPTEALWQPPGFDRFIFRLRHLTMEGGFSLVCGDPGLGKSKCLQLLQSHLEKLPDVVVGVMERPQSSVADFYREMGAIFAVGLSPSNRYGGFKALRQRWHDHIRTTLYRPVLLIDEAQEMGTDCLKEIRLLGSERFDSQCLLTTVLAGDMQLIGRFRHPDLLSLGSRIRARLNIEAYGRDVLMDYLEHSLQMAGATHLMTPGLKTTLVEHAAGNLRMLNMMASELLDLAAQSQAGQLDEQLFIKAFSPAISKKKGRKHTGASDASGL